MITEILEIEQMPDGFSRILRLEKFFVYQSKVTIFRPRLRPVLPGDEGPFRVT